MARDLYRLLQTAVGQQITGSNFYPTTLDIQPSLKSGWLRKLGGVVKSWQKRWFTMKGDSMYYYASNDESKAPVGVIFLPGSHVVEHPFSTTDPDKFLFEIAPDTPERPRMAPTHETYLLAAESDDERKEWIKAIKQVLYASIGGAIFGRPLEDTLRFEMVRDRKRKIPEIVQLCVEYITKHGLNDEGIFRLPGRSNLIKKLCDAFDRGERPEIDVPEMDVHTVASLLKAYLRDLPGPLIPVEFYELVMRIILREMPVGEEKALNRLIELIHSIPVANYNVLHYICQFLCKVAAHCDKNKMTSINLATIFVQSFIRPEDDDPALLMATASCRTLATLLFIERCERIFNVDYTSEGTVIVVDDLLGLCDNGEKNSSCESTQASEVSLNPDLFGLEINGSELQPAIRRYNSTRGARVVTAQKEIQLDQVGNRRGGMFIHNSQSSHEAEDDPQFESESNSYDDSTVNEGELNSVQQELSVGRSGTQPIAPPRLLGKRSKPISKQTVQIPNSLHFGTDRVAVETLINLDTKNFSEPDLRTHIDRLCQELVIRQKIIDDMNEKAQIIEQRHEKQVDAILQKMAENRVTADRYSKQLHLYEDKYGPLGE